MLGNIAAGWSAPSPVPAAARAGSPLVRFLVLGGLQAVRELCSGRRRSRDVSDVDLLAARTRVPSGIRTAGFGLSAGAP